MSAAAQALRKVPDLPNLVRRHLLLTGLALLALPRPAFARPEDVDYVMRQDFGRIDTTPGPITITMPDHADAGTSVPLDIIIDSPMTADDYPETVRIYATNNPRPRIATLHFTPLGGSAKFSTRIRLNGAQDVVVVVLTSAGAFWRADRHVSVAFGACATAGESDGLPPDWQPTNRIAVPETAAKDAVIDIRTIITHPMETGLRLNAGNQYVPLRIIETFDCHVDGTLAFSARLEPAIATNPYLAFDLRLDASARISFDWRDTTGAIYHDEAAVTVT